MRMQHRLKSPPSGALKQSSTFFNSAHSAAEPPTKSKQASNIVRSKDVMFGRCGMVHMGIKLAFGRAKARERERERARAKYEETLIVSVNRSILSSLLFVQSSSLFLFFEEKGKN